jgi:putrescine aminotransferase
VGLIGAIELSNDKARRGRFAKPGRVGSMCRDNCIHNGLIMRACWDTMVLSPPLVISRQEIDKIVQLARVALDATYAEVKAEVV